MELLSRKLASPTPLQGVPHVPIQLLLLYLHLSASLLLPGFNATHEAVQPREDYYPDKENQREHTDGNLPCAVVEGRCANQATAGAALVLALVVVQTLGILGSVYHTWTRGVSSVDLGPVSANTVAAALQVCQRAV